MPETLETSVEGVWNVDSAGGPRKVNKKDNPYWCKNPQYFFNIQKPTHVKVNYYKKDNPKEDRKYKKEQRYKGGNDNLPFSSTRRVVSPKPKVNINSAK
jgi:hypothetical protein